MNILQNLKLDTWYGIVLYLGTASIIASFIMDIQFLEEKNMFGIGIGMIILSLSFYISEKDITTLKEANAYTGPTAYITYRIRKHSIISVVILLLGIILIGIFGFKIIKNLI